MRALTIWQPWASLIIAGAKPYEFRQWPAPQWVRGQRIAIHAGARPISRAEVRDLLRRLEIGERATALDIAKAVPIVETALKEPQRFPRAAILGSAVLGTPREASVLFGGRVADSRRIDQHLWAWPLHDIEALQPPEPARGFQGFWKWEGRA